MNVTKWFVRFVPLSCGILLLSSARGESQEFHEPAQIFKIMEESSISYGIDISDDVESALAPPDQLTPGYTRVIGDDGTPTLETSQLSEKASPSFMKAEEHFQKNNFDSAIVEYRNVLKIQPAYLSAWTMIGDAFFNMEAYDSAEFYLKKSIDLNYIDYQAHWFLSSVEFKVGKQEEGLQELTIAHVLNPGHTLLAQVLKTARKKAGREWNEWSFEPRYTLNDESLEEVKINCAPGWMMYGVVKALWAYEPDYAADMGVEDLESLQGITMSEKESIIMFLYETLTRREHVGEDGFEEAPEADSLAEHLMEVTKEGFIDPFIYYEIIGKQSPIIFSMMEPESVRNIALYVDKFH